MTTEFVRVNVIDPTTGTQAPGGFSGATATRTAGADADHVRFTLLAAQVGEQVKRAKPPRVLAITDKTRTVWIGAGPPVLDGANIIVAAQKKS